MPSGKGVLIENKLITSSKPRSPASTKPVLLARGTRSRDRLTGPPAIAFRGPLTPALCTCASPGQALRIRDVLA
jgi:hypothetical protein